MTAPSDEKARDTAVKLLRMRQKISTSRDRSENIRNRLNWRAGQILQYPEYPTGMRWLKWLEREFTDRKVRGSNPTPASRLPLSRLGQPGSIPALA
ncbi:hypothetical protein T265_00561 [Opisthorchis viverrini]|uniref:Uncharacterized protein n=1 Tax=Opisthorchis viverrini TaxID=6198 RepID=A0A075ACN3_OPIVI|nr:hypothetical protein T265_00561 [Opisthorchis viverrini]KER33680.1 hypothetical protein T265_00561 [Opisthorchis viverrini]